MYNVDLPLPRGRQGAPREYPISSLLGGETSAWNEHADHINLQQRVLTRAAAVAERLWSGEPSQLDVARQRLARCGRRTAARTPCRRAVSPRRAAAPLLTVPRTRHCPRQLHRPYGRVARMLGRALARSSIHARAPKPCAVVDWRLRRPVSCRDLLPCAAGAVGCFGAGCMRHR